MFAIYGHIDQDEEKKNAEIVKRWRDIVRLGRRTMVQQERDVARRSAIENVTLSMKSSGFVEAGVKSRHESAS